MGFGLLKFSSKTKMSGIDSYYTNLQLNNSIEYMPYLKG